MLSPEQLKRIYEAAAAGRQIEAVRAYQEATGAPDEDALAYVEELAGQFPRPSVADTPAAAPQASAGEKTWAGIAAELALSKPQKVLAFVQAMEARRPDIAARIYQAATFCSPAEAEAAVNGLLRETERTEALFGPDLARFKAMPPEAQRKFWTAVSAGNADKVARSYYDATGCSVQAANDVAAHLIRQRREVMDVVMAANRAPRVLRSLSPAGVRLLSLVIAILISAGIAILKLILVPR